MPLLRENRYTSEDYWNLPKDERAELIDGKLYAMAPPNRIHQKLIMKFSTIFSNYISSNNGSCEVYAAPTIIPFDQTIQVGIYSDLKITISELL